MPKLKSLIHEVHRRSLWQVLAVYLAGSFGALQVVDVLAKNVGLPEWVAPLAIALLVIGLPIVLATAIVQEGPPSVAAPEPRSSVIVLPHSARDQQLREQPRSQQLLTWRRAILGGIVAFATLGSATTGFVAMRSMGLGPIGSLRAKGVLGERAQLVVADFGSTAGDTLLARAATEAFRVDLAQSPDVAVFEPRQLAQVLSRMQRQPDAPLDAALATEIAAREGAAAIVVGEVNPVGRGFLLTVRLLGASDGQELASLRETARDTVEVIPAIDKLSKRLRERIGESYKSLQRGQPLARVTTASLEALRKYSQGARAIDLSGDESRGIAQLEEAIALDTAFAMAYRKLGIVLSNSALDRARAVEALTRAYRHRERLTTRERYLTEASYLTSVTWQPEQAISVFASMLELDSTDAYAYNNTGVVYSRMGDEARAAGFYLRAIGADSLNSLSYTNAVSALVAAGRADEAGTWLARFRERFPAAPRYHEFAGLLAAARGDYDAAERSLLLLRDSAASRALRTVANENLSYIAAVRGRLQAADELTRLTIAADDAMKLAGSALTRLTDLAAHDVLVRRDANRAVQRLEDALRERPLDSMHALDRPYATLATMFAAAGRPDRARALLAEYDAAVTPELRNWIERALHEIARTELALAEQRPADAIATIRRGGQSNGCPRCQYVYIGRAFDALGQPDSALAAYERYLDTPSLRSIMLLDRWYLVAVLERLAALHEQKGDTDRAIEYYDRITKLWQHADPELQPRVQAARARLEQLVKTRG